VEQAASMGMMLGHALWLACLGEAYLLAGRREDAITLTEQAHAELSAAIELYRTMTMTFWLLKAEAGFAVLEGR